VRASEPQDLSHFFPPSSDRADADHSTLIKHVQPGLCAAAISGATIAAARPSASTILPGMRWRSVHGGNQPWPINGLLVAITVMNWTFASRGRLAI
jgi:hypothetical protein